MGCKKGKCHRQALLAQFCYEHQKLECCMRKIRKNAEELCKILDSMPPVSYTHLTLPTNSRV